MYIFLHMLAIIWICETQNLFNNNNLINLPSKIEDKSKLADKNMYQ